MTETSWFDAARYGMFIHWGAYAVAARGEWVLNRERIPYDEYIAKYVNHFTAEHYDPRAWARLAKQAGMGYMVLTTKHHDGFCLWDTDTTDFNAAKMGPQRDLVAPYVEAARAEGLKVGLYYSVADWHHPDYPGPYYRDWPRGWRSEEARRRFVQYYRAHLEELMTRYGEIDLLWYDGCVPQPTDGAEVNSYIKQLQPGILINNRNGEPCDFWCSEQRIKPGEPGKMWEACMTLNDNWGYHAGDHNYKTAKQVISMLATTAGKGGNLLLNVGPKADGAIPQESVDILTEAGAWLARNREFLANSARLTFHWNNNSLLTAKGNRLYVHLMNGPGEAEYCLTDLKNRVLAARYLDGGAPVPFEQQGPRLFLRDLPNPLPDPIATTIVLEVEGEPGSMGSQDVFWIVD